MKPKAFDKKLRLNKSTVVNLTKNQLDSIYGGDTYSLTLPDSVCLCIVSYRRPCTEDEEDSVCLCLNTDYC